MKGKVMALLASNDVLAISLTTDLWTSIAHDLYISIMSHFLDLEWNLKYVMIAFE